MIRSPSGVRQVRAQQPHDSVLLPRPEHQVHGQEDPAGQLQGGGTEGERQSVQWLVNLRLTEHKIMIFHKLLEIFRCIILIYQTLFFHACNPIMRERL